MAWRNTAARKDRWAEQPYSEMRRLSIAATIVERSQLSVGNIGVLEHTINEAFLTKFCGETRRPLEFAVHQGL